LNYGCRNSENFNESSMDIILQILLYILVIMLFVSLVVVDGPPGHKSLYLAEQRKITEHFG